MTERVAVDRDVLREFLRANAGNGTDPEGVAALRVCMYVAELWVVPTVSDELTREGDPDAALWRDVGVGEIHDDSDAYHGCITTKTYRYMDYHVDPRNCRVVAEAECAHLDALLTLSDTLINNLADRVEQLVIRKPSEYWARLDLPHGAVPRWTPDIRHPLRNVDWWRW